MRKLLDNVLTFLRGDLTLLEHRTTSRWGRIGLRQLRIFLYVGKRLVLGRHNERAAALTYLTLLALIPLLAVVFSLVKAFGGFADLTVRVRDFLLDYIPDSSDQVASWLQTFIENFNAATVGFVGMGALLVTLILTLSAIETALDQTWAVRKSRSWGRRLLVYWSLLTLSPLFLGLSLAATASLSSNRFALWLSENLPLFGVLRAIVPVLATAFAFTMMYTFLPSTRVRVGPAFVGGLSAAVFFELAKWGYATYTARSVSTNTLYGSLAAFPVFIIWVNYSWRILLSGADIVHATQYASTDPTEETDPRTNQVTREEASVRICALVATAFAKNQTPPTIDEICRRLLLPAHLADVLCQHLLNSGLIRQISNKSRGLTPGRPLEALTVADIIDVLRHKVGQSHWSTSSDQGDHIDALLLGCERENMEAMRKVRWLDLVDTQVKGRSDTPPIEKKVVNIREEK
jgi:membrane protein